MVTDHLNALTATPHVAGVDGCPYGWVSAVYNLDTQKFAVFVHGSFGEVLQHLGGAEIIAVDIPIGLPDAAEPGGRLCDRVARSLLGPGKTSSVFSPPCRAVLDCGTYRQALEVNRGSSSHGIGLSIQAYNIVGKIREVDQALGAQWQDRVREVHPELSFRALNGGRVLGSGKKSQLGRNQRRRLLARNGFPRLGSILRNLAGKKASVDDILDACAACWTARRIVNGDAEQIPTKPPVDSRGLRMEMWI